MQVIILSWEFPPRMVGQLADYVMRLAHQLVKNDVETHVVTYHDYLTGQHKESEGVNTTRVSNPVRTHIGVLTWVLTLNQEVVRAASNIYHESNKMVDLIDVHDWHFLQSAVTLKKAFDIPFVFSVESLEEHRSHGANFPFNMAIKSLEWLGLYEAKRAIVKSEWMRDEVVRLYRVPVEKIVVIKPRSKTWIPEVLEAYRNVVGGSSSK